MFEFNDLETYSGRDPDCHFLAQTFELNKLVNKVMGKKYPTNNQERIFWSLKHGQPKLGDILTCFDENYLSLPETLSALAALKNKPFSETTWGPTAQPIDNKDTKIFTCDVGYGDDVWGTTVFSPEQAEISRKNGNNPILVIDQFPASLYPKIQEFSGIVSLRTDIPGHLVGMAHTANIPIMVGAPQDARIVKAPDLNDWTLTYNTLTIKPGDMVTLRMLSSHKGELYAGRLFSDASILGLLDDIHNLFSFFDETKLSETTNTPEFMANINAKEQITRALNYSKGIGLVRTEALAFSDAKQFTCLKAILSEETPDIKKYQTFYKKHSATIRDLFACVEEHLLERGDNKSYPLTVRLLDIPIREILGPNTPAYQQNMRGAQLCMQKPKLYMRQIQAIFDAYANHLTTSRGGQNPSASIALSLLMPRVQTQEEILSIKTMIDTAADERHLDARAIPIGMMADTPSITRRIRTLAPRVDFIAIGSNDWTCAAHGIDRSDYAAQRRYVVDHPDMPDPFVTLPDQMARAFIRLARAARKANPKIKIGLCGDHATDLTSLKKLRPAQLDYVSVAPSFRNLVALRADLTLYNLKNTNRRRTLTL